MTLDITKPTDQELVSDLPAYIRENREAIEDIIAGVASIDTTVLPVAPGTISLYIGDELDLSAVKIEQILISGMGESTIQYILNGTQGQVKTFIFQDSDITLKDGVKSNGKIFLNQMMPLSTFISESGDIISFINIGGDGDSVHGYWKELYRNLAVK